MSSGKEFRWNREKEEGTPLCEPCAYSAAVSRIDTVTAVSLILVYERKKRWQQYSSIDSDLNVNVFSKGPLLKMFFS